MICRQIWFIAQADFKERTRRHSFLALCALAVFAAFLFVPNPDAKMTSIAVDMQYFSQAANWTWIPMASALCTGILLPVTGFFYLRNALNFDGKTGIADFVYTSPVRKVTYMSGKYLSNLQILFCMLVVVTLTSYGMAVLKFPGVRISPVHCVSYFVAILPGIFLCAALALAAEAVPLFQGRIGVWMAGSVYFAVYMVYLGALFDDSPGNIIRFFDMTGFLWIKDSMNQSVYAVTGKAAQVAVFVYEEGMINNPKLPELFFVPLSFTVVRLFEKSCMIVSGMVLCVAVSFLVQRRENTTKISAGFEKIHKNSRGHGLFITEIILTFRGCSPVWFTVMLSLWLSMLFTDMETAQGTVWIVSTAWSCILFSDYGCREKESNLDTLLPAFVHAYPRQLFIRFCAGGMLSVFVSAPVILRAFFRGEYAEAAAGIMFALFIPALSIFFGQISGSERMFEIGLLVICYVMLNTVSFIRLAADSGKAMLYCGFILIITFLMLVISCWMRRVS